MDYPAQYRTQILNAIQSIDLEKVGQIIQIFNSARAHGRRIFVCGHGGTDSVAAQFLCDMVSNATANRSPRFRILALSDQQRRIAPSIDDSAGRIFVEQLKNFAEPEDVVMAVCISGNPAQVKNAIEYARWIGCKTIGLTGCEGGDVARLADLVIQIPAHHMGSTEDAHMVICHMIGYYFVDVEAVAGRGA